MLGGECGGAGTSFVEGLLEELIAGALGEPCGDAVRKGAVAGDGDDGDFPTGLDLGVVLLHLVFVGGELLLDAGALVAGGASEVLLSVAELIVVEAELGLGDLEVVRGGEWGRL